VIEAEKATYPIKRMCELLEVSRSGFYQWRSSRGRGPSPSQRRRAALDSKVAASHAASDGVYGAPRVLADLRADGERVSRKTVAASLRRQGLAGISPRTFAPATTVVDLDAPVPKDLVKRRFDTGALNLVWTSDITYLRTGEGWLYLCAVRDGCSRRVIGWAIDDHMRSDLVETAVTMAVALRGELAETVILHADYAEVCVKPRICGDGLCWRCCVWIPRLNVRRLSQTVEGLEFFFGERTGGVGVDRAGGCVDGFSHHVQGCEGVERCCGGGVFMAEEPHDDRQRDSM
jgi:hypothetical protein